MTNLPLVGEALCLDFVNTVDTWQQTPSVEHLGDYPALAAWAARAGVLSGPQAARLARLAATRGPEAARAHSRAISLREAIYHLLAPGWRDGPSAPWLAVLNEEFRLAAGSMRVDATADGYRQAFQLGDQLDQLLWPVTRSAVETATSATLGRVRACEGADCGWLFLDTSKAGRRRWCSMAICGNRAKMKRHRGRTLRQRP